MPGRSSPASRALLRLVPAPRGPGPNLRAEDEALLSAVERGDRGVGSALYDRLHRSVDATLYRIVGRRDSEYDDLVQVAFEQIVTTITRRKFARACSLNSWAAAVACNVALNAVRRRITERKFVDPSGALDAALEHTQSRSDVEREVGTRRAFERVRHHLSEMSPLRAETLLLHDMLGHELSEIAVLTGVSITAAQSRLVRGRTELRERLERDPAFTGEEMS